MPGDRLHERLRRSALLSVVPVAVVPAAIRAGLDDGIVLGVYVVVALGLFWAWGAFQADIALNPRLDDAGRRRWRIAMACVPGAMALYWAVHVRPHQAWRRQ